MPSIPACALCGERMEVARSRFLGDNPDPVARGERGKIVERANGPSNADATPGELRGLTWACANPECSIGELYTWPHYHDPCDRCECPGCRFERRKAAIREREANRD